MCCAVVVAVALEVGVSVGEFTRLTILVLDGTGWDGRLVKQSLQAKRREREPREVEWICIFYCIVLDASQVCWTTPGLCTINPRVNGIQVWIIFELHCEHCKRSQWPLELETLIRFAMPWSVRTGSKNTPMEKIYLLHCHVTSNVFIATCKIDSFYYSATHKLASVWKNRAFFFHSVRPSVCLLSSQIKPPPECEG